MVRSTLDMAISSPLQVETNTWLFVLLNLQVG